MRHICNPITWAGIALLAFAPALAGQDRPARPQAEIARDLRSHDRDTVAHALAEIPLGYDPDDELGWKFRPGYVVTPELSAALISAADREARLHMDGCTPTGIGGRHLELSLELEHFLIALRDPTSIPALVQMICSGGGVRQALMRFGPQIIPYVVAWAKSGDAAWDDVVGSYTALIIAVDRWGETLSPEMRASIRDVTLLHLGPETIRFPTPVRRSFVLEEAITMASMLRDPELLEVLADIAEEGHEALEGMSLEDVSAMMDRARRGLTESLWWGRE